MNPDFIDVLSDATSDRNAVRRLAIEKLFRRDSKHDKKPSAVDFVAEGEVSKLAL